MLVNTPRLASKAKALILLTLSASEFIGISENLPNTTAHITTIEMTHATTKKTCFIVFNSSESIEFFISADKTSSFNTHLSPLKTSSPLPDSTSQMVYNHLYNLQVVFPFLAVRLLALISLTDAQVLHLKQWSFEEYCTKTY